jgi:homoserine acetyltransferase
MIITVYDMIVLESSDIAQFDVSTAKSVYALSMGTEKNSVSSESAPRDVDALIQLSTGLLHIAAANDIADAQMGLFKR